MLSSNSSAKPNWKLAMVLAAGLVCGGYGIAASSAETQHGSVSAAGAVSGAHSASAVETNSVTRDEKILHLLNRITFGPRPGDVDDVRKMGIDKFIQQQLSPESMKQPDEIVAYLQQDEAINGTPVELFQKYGRPTIKAFLNVQKNNQDEASKKELQKTVKEGYQKMYQEAAAARLKRAVESPRQLQEVMTDFWFNHFNVSLDKGLDHIWVGTYEEQAIRPYALGKFHDLVEATCHHPAMLFYLDNWQNTKSDANQDPKRKGRFKGLNENYARELMELHTLGVDGGYTQQDVIQLARVLTGLGLPPQRPEAFSRVQGKLGKYGDLFDPNRHDFGEKVLLGHRIQGKGEAEIEEAIDILCKAPATAHHISYQLAQYFVADEPPKSLVDKLTNKFEQTDGDIKAVLTELFHSPEFWDEKYYDAKFKNPYRYVISSLRAANVALDDYKPVLGFFTQLGMPLYRCLTPDGYKNTQVAWLSGDSLLRRITFATGLGAGKLPNNPMDPLSYKDVSIALGDSIAPKTKEEVEKSPEPLKSALLLGSPEFMNY